MRLVGAVGALVLALLAGMVVWLTAASPTPADRGPFDAAVFDLGDAHAVRYRVGDGPAQLDVRVTNGGEAVGTGTVAGLQYGFLVVDGKLFVKPPDDLLSGLASSAPTGALKGKWITGGSFGATVPGASTQFPTPAQLAAQLQSALDTARNFPKVGALGTSMDGVPALEVSTRQGDLYVTKEYPYRVLRLVTSGGPTARPSLPSLPTLSSLVGRAGPVASPAVREAAATSVTDASLDTGGLGTMDVSDMTPDQVAGTYHDLEADTADLSNAVNADIQFQLNGNADLSCSAGGCEVTAHVSANASAGNPNAKVTGGQVSAEMTATVTIEGQPASGCTSAGPLPLNGPGQISCEDGAAGAVFAEVDAEKKQQAEAESRAAGGVPVPYTVNSLSEVYVTATAQIDVQVLVKKEQQEAQRAADEAGCDETANHSFTANTPVLMADGTAEPIQSVRVGDEIENARPGGGDEQHRVDLVHRTTTDTDFTTLTIATPDGPRAITSTSNHPYFDAASREWRNAGQIPPGHRLLTPGRGTAIVLAARSFVEPQTTYDLTIDAVHTYYVLAGPVPVLVHNSSCLVSAARDFPGLAHALDEHVGLTDQQAIRLARSKNSGQNSVFVDQSTAQQVADYAVANNATRIRNWLRGPDQQLPINGRFGVRNPLGTLYRADGSKSPTGNGYFMQLVRSRGYPGGFYIATLYPV